MTSTHSRRLAALEKMPRASIEPPAPEVPISEALVDAVRGGLLTFDQRWLSVVDYCQDLADLLNELREDQPGAVLVPLWPAEFTEASEALAAGRFALIRNLPPYDAYQPKDARTRTPMLCAAPGESGAIESLARNVHTAARHCHFQTGEPMPSTLAEFGAWLSAARHLAIS